MFPAGVFNEILPRKLAGICKKPVGSLEFNVSLNTAAENCLEYEFKRVLKALLVSSQPVQLGEGWTNRFDRCFKCDRHMGPMGSPLAKHGVGFAQGAIG